MTKQELEKDQLVLMDIIIKTCAINIVTCPDCGRIILHRLHVPTIQCPDCGVELEVNEFPDFIF